MPTIFTGGRVPVGFGLGVIIVQLVLDVGEGPEALGVELDVGLGAGFTFGFDRNIATEILETTKIKSSASAMKANRDFFLKKEPSQ